jgi:hypothetical protein
MAAMSRAKISRQKRRKFNFPLVIIGCSFVAIFLVLMVIQHQSLNSEQNQHHIHIPNIRRKNTFVPTLRNKRILFEITTVGLRQYSHFESVLDGVRDLCEAGAKVSLHITTSNCPPSTAKGSHGDSNYECPLYDRAFETTLENNYSVERLSQLNERLHCRNIDGSLDVKIHLISPDWGKQVVDHHRRIFYENLDDYDLFVHGEEDAMIRPTNIIAFMDEMHKLELLVGKEHISDYSIGFVRYENQVDTSEKQRVVWEFDWGDDRDFKYLIVNDSHPNINGKYFSSPGEHHQGMYMATHEQLRQWRNREPNCEFDRPTRRYGYHRERISGAIDLYDEDYCNVTQLIPLETMEDFFIHHLPDANHNRMPHNIISTMNLHKRRMKILQSIQGKTSLPLPWTDPITKKYNGIDMFIDERNETLFLPYDLADYNKYTKRGGTLDKMQLEEYEWD